MSQPENLTTDSESALLNDIGYFEIEKMDDMEYNLGKIDFLKKVLDMYANFHIYSIAFAIDDSTYITKKDTPTALLDKISQIVEGIKELELAEVENKTFSEFIPGVNCRQMLEILLKDKLDTLSEASYYAKWEGYELKKTLTFENASPEIRLLSLKIIAIQHIEKRKKNQTESSES